MKISRRRFLTHSGATVVVPALLSVSTPGRAGASAKSDVLTIAQTNDLLSFDPANHGNNSTESGLINLYDYLVRKEFTNGQMRFVPGLAKAWRTDDQVRWTFDLHDDVRWHDGKPFTAEDVRFTIERLQQDNTLRSAARFNSIQAVNILGPHRLELVARERDPLLLHHFVGNGGLILPQHTFGAAASAEAFFARPIGTGPYRFGEWRRGDRVILERNPDWWEGESHWRRVVIRGVPETATRVAELLTGGVDVATNIPPEDIGRVRQNAGTRISAFNIARNLALHVRTESGPVTQDIRVREAIDLAINREEITRIVMEGFGTPTRGLFPPEIPGHHAGLSGSNAYDPERARRLIKEAGAVRAPIRLATPSGRWLKDREVAEAIVGYLEDAGLAARLEVLEWSVYNSRIQSDGLGELYLWGMGSYTDASSLLVLAQLKRFHHHWSDPEFSRLATEVNRAPDEAARQAILLRAQEIVTGQRLRIGIAYPQAVYGVNERVSFAGRFDEMIPAEQVRRT